MQRERPADHVDLIVTPDAATAARAAAERIAHALADAVRIRGRADWATTGGSAAPEIYRRLVEPPLRDAVPWSHVHVWWGDDRFVPRDHALSNIKPLDDILLDPERPVAIPVSQLHPFRTSESIAAGWDAERTAKMLADELATAGLPTKDGWPVLDLVLIGIGTDGHLLSVFPGSSALGSDAWALAIPAPTHIEPHVERVTLNPAILGTARKIVAVASGAGKAGILESVFGPERDPDRWPCQLAVRPNATWILDEAAAARLRR
jgi:6-phosphogluconolactonase